MDYLIYRRRWDIIYRLRWDIIKRLSLTTVMSKYGCGIKVHSGEIWHELLCSKHTLARYEVSQNSPKSASKASTVLYASSTMSSVRLLVLFSVAVSLALGVLFLLGLELSRSRAARKNPSTPVYSMWGQLGGASCIKLLEEEVLFSLKAF